MRLQLLTRDYSEVQGAAKVLPQALNDFSSKLRNINK